MTKQLFKLSFTGNDVFCVSATAEDTEAIKEIKRIKN